MPSLLCLSHSFDSTYFWESGVIEVKRKDKTKHGIHLGAELSTSCADAMHK